MYLDQSEIDALNDEICFFYESESDTAKIESACAVIGILNFLLTTRNPARLTKPVETNTEDNVEF